MGRPTGEELLELRDFHESWLSRQPGVKQTGVELSPEAGAPTLKIYHDKAMTPEVEKAIRARFGARIPVEFQEASPGDEVIPY